MTPATILAAVEAKGAKLQVVDGDKIAITPRGAADDRLRDAIRAHKPALLTLLRAGDLPVAPSFSYFDSPYAALFADLTGDLGTHADLDAIEWAELNGWPTIAATLRAIDRRCEVLAARDDEPAFRHAVAQLVALFQAIRAAFAAAQSAPPMDKMDTTPVSDPPSWRLVVGPMHLKPAPVRLDAARTVHDVAAFVESTLAEVERTVALRNSGRGTYLSDVIDERLEQLRLCGCEVAVEALQ